MRDLFEVINGCADSAANIVFTLLEGECLGEKALSVDGNVIWESSKNGFFSRHKEALLNCAGSGIMEIDDCKVFCDIQGGETQIVVCGGGHVSMPVIQIGVMLGCRVTVLEDRPQFADNARKEGADIVICDSFERGLERIEGSADTYFVIVTRGHRYDTVCLEQITKKEHAYIGMIGSRRRVALVKETLIEKGCDRAVLERVYSPIGLDIGARTPAEIGVAIMAEIIEVKNKKKRTGGYSRDILRAILDKEHIAEKMVLATIVSRHGSAPQGVGVKMLVFPDGKCVGTIGGGCMEAEVLRKALLMLRSEERAFELCRVNLTGAEAEDEGMVCGGVVDVMLEMF